MLKTFKFWLLRRLLREYFSSKDFDQHHLVKMKLGPEAYNKIVFIEMSYQSACAITAYTEWK